MEQQRLLNLYNLQAIYLNCYSYLNAVLDTKFVVLDSNIEVQVVLERQNNKLENIVELHLYP